MRSFLGVLFCAGALIGCGPAKPMPSTEEMTEIRIVVRSSEADPTVAVRWDTYKQIIGKATNLPVKTFETNNYNGNIQAIASGQVDFAQIGASAYANIYAQVGELVAPVMAVREAEGSMGYYSALMVKADSPYRTIADLKGKSLGYVDLNSTSGYLFPRSAMKAEGIDPDTFFSASGFAGGHSQAVLALENGQYDAVIAYVSGGDPQNGFSTGSLYTMARNGLVDLDDFRFVWTAGPMPNSPMMARTDRPQAIRDAALGAIASIPFDAPDAWVETGQNPGSVFAAVDHDFYREVIRLRDEELIARRAGGAAK
jgi:phosphonate transport system substrate-binding protein